MPRLSPWNVSREMKRQSSMLADLASGQTHDLKIRNKIPFNIARAKAKQSLTNCKMNCGGTFAPLKLACAALAKIF
jgi:hypothetical protein